MLYVGAVQKRLYMDKKTTDLGEIKEEYESQNEESTVMLLFLTSTLQPVRFWRPYQEPA